MKNKIKNSKKLKLKYFTDIYKFLPDYPTIEDFKYIVSKWFYNENGYFILKEKLNLEDDNVVYFTSTYLRNFIDDIEKYNNLIELLLKDKKIKIVREGKVTTYFKVLS